MLGNGRMADLMKLHRGVQAGTERQVWAVRDRVREPLGKRHLKLSAPELKLNSKTFPKLDHDAAVFINFVRDNLIDGN